MPHRYGNPVEFAVPRRLGVPVIEDCAQSLGSTYQGDKWEPSESLVRKIFMPKRPWHHRGERDGLTDNLRLLEEDPRFA